MAQLNFLLKEFNKNKERREFMDSQRVIRNAITDFEHLCFSDLAGDIEVIVPTQNKGQSQKMTLNDFALQIISESKENQWQDHLKRSERAKKSARRVAHQGNNQPMDGQPRNGANNA